MSFHSWKINIDETFVNIYEKQNINKERIFAIEIKNLVDNGDYIQSFIKKLYDFHYEKMDKDESKNPL